MKQFRTAEIVSGAAEAIVVYAENTMFSIKILHAVFGAANVISVPTEIQHAH